MSPKKILMLLFALCIASGAFVLAKQALKPPPTPAEVEAQKPKGPEILVVTRDIKPGAFIRMGDLTWKEIAEAPAENMVVKGGMEDKQSYDGALTREPIKAGAPIMSDKIFKAGDQGFLSAVMGAGMRAISVKITNVTGVAGLVFPGDRVDVVVAHDVPVASSDGREEKRRVSETVVRNARVLAMDQTTDERNSKPKVADVATIEVTPKDAEKIALVTNWGSQVMLVLRSLSEKTSGLGQETENEKSKEFTWDSDVSAVLAPPRLTNTDSHPVQVIRGKESTEVDFRK